MSNKPAWQENAPAFLKPGNMETYAAPRDWDKACAIQNLRAGVRLTDAQKKRFLDLARVEAGLLEAKKGVKARCHVIRPAAHRTAGTHYQGDAE